MRVRQAHLGSVGWYSGEIGSAPTEPQGGEDGHPPGGTGRGEPLADRPRGGGRSRRSRGEEMGSSGPDPGPVGVNSVVPWLWCRTGRLEPRAWKEPSSSSTSVSPDQPDRRVLPPPDPSFGGRIEVALEDSTGDSRAAGGAAGRTECAAGHGRRHRLWPHERVRWPGRYAGVRPAREPGAALHQLPHLGGVRGVAGGAADRAQRPFGGHGRDPGGLVGFPGYTAIIPRSAATVLEILRQNGYGTALVGKTHLTPIHEITAAGPFDRWPGAWARSTSTVSSAPV